MNENPPAFKARLGISPKTVRAGGNIRIRVENYGTEAVSYGYAYGLERLRKGIWIDQPTGPFLAPRLYVAGESAGACQVIRIESDALDGTYRISKKVSSSALGKHEPRIVQATFRVR